MKIKFDFKVFILVILLSILTSSYFIKENNYFNIVVIILAGIIMVYESAADHLINKVHKKYLDYLCPFLILSALISLIIYYFFFRSNILIIPYIFLIINEIIEIFIYKKKEVFNYLFLILLIICLINSIQNFNTLNMIEENMHINN